MVIFLAGVAFLIILIVLGDRAAAGMRHAGTQRYLDHCVTCGKRYPRPLGVPREHCPHGHPIVAGMEDPVVPRAWTTPVIAVCAGFIAVVLVLVATGVVGLP